MPVWSEVARAADLGGEIRDLLSKPDFGPRDLQAIASLSRWFQVETLAHQLVIQLGPTVRAGRG